MVRVVTWGPVSYTHLDVYKRQIQKSGSWYSYKDSRLGQGADNVKKLLGDNPELADEIETLIRAKVGLKPV